MVIESNEDLRLQDDYDEPDSDAGEGDTPGDEEGGKDLDLDEKEESEESSE